MISIPYRTEADAKEEDIVYSSDKPIIDPTDDLLNRRNFATLLAKSLMSLNTGDAFTIGLFGKWGTGKTSLVNMALHELESLQSTLNEDEKTIVVRFEPWNFTDANQLVSQFFVRIVNTFRSKKDKRLNDIGNAIEKYSEAFGVASVIPVVGEAISFTARIGARMLGQRLKKDLDDKDALKQKSYIEKLLEKQNSRILIVIDDIDRLSNDQIRHIFQLVTAVAKLPNITYLLVFDKEIVTNALEAVQGSNGNDYLEKVIQMPISIPDLRKTDLNNILFTKLNQLTAKNTGVVFEQSYWDQIFQHCINPYITTLRDVNRLCNSLQYKLTPIASEVNFVDLCAITLIEIKFPLVYSWIKEHKPILTGENDWTIGLEQNKSQDEYRLQYINEMKQLLKGEKEAEDFIKVISVLFPYFGNKTGKWSTAIDLNLSRRHDNISHPRRFDRYFELNLDFICLKKAEITNIAYYANEAQASKAIIDIDKNGYGRELLDELMAHKDTLTEERAIILVKALFSTAAILSKSNSSVFTTSPSRYANTVIRNITESISAEKRFDVLSTILKNGGERVLSTFATLLNTIELSYGRLAANGNERGFEKIISLKELEQLESLFCDCAEQVLNEHCLVDLSEWRIILYIMECFRPEYVNEYMQKLLKSDKNVLKYIVSCVTTWSGAETSFELSEGNEKYISKERAIEVIERAKDNGLIFTLILDIQIRIAALYLALNNMYSDEYDRQISDKQAEYLLDKWRNKSESI